MKVSVITSLIIYLFSQFSYPVEQPASIAEVHASDTSSHIGIIELRNYVIKTGGRDQFIDYFEKNLIAPQEALHGYILGQYRVKNEDNNFFWIRGFENMQARSSFLPAFYYGPTWQQHKAVANPMLANNDNVYLLQPMVLQGDSLIATKVIDRSQLSPGKRIAVVDFYIANTRLAELLSLFAKSYVPLARKSGVKQMTLWTSVLQENDFPRLPVFQDKNLLVTISFYDSESAYKKTMKRIASQASEDLQSKLQDVITTQHTMILYPTEQTSLQQPQS